MIGQNSTAFTINSVCNPLPDDKIVASFELKAFADDNRNVTQAMNLSSIGLKASWEKEKMLVTSILSFSHNAF